MTERDATNMSCPIKIGPIASGLLIAVGCTDGAIDKANELSLCSASRCPAWRWSEDNPVKLGYCGLAGKPAVAF